MITEVRRLVAEGSNELLAELAQGGAVKSKHLLIGWERGDDTTRRLIGEAADALAMVVGNTAALLDLRRVVLGGGVVDKLGSEFLDLVRASDHFGGFGPEHVDVIEAHRLDDAGAVGAAIIAADRFPSLR
jgi:predicted NBD/HSP70 family sugar kinase